MPELSANPCPLQQAPLPGDLILHSIPKGRSRYSKAVMQMLEMQDLIYLQFKTTKMEPGELSQLALAFTRLQECIRVSRGIPSPGQLRPDLDPVQMARMLKRARKRQPIDIPQDIRDALKTKGKKSWQESPEDKSPIEPSNEALTHDSPPPIHLPKTC